MIGSATSGVGGAAAQWKALTSTNGAASPAATGNVFKSTGAKGDSVSVSPLGDALTGIASDVFNALDPKARQTLEGIVKSGRMSADEVVLGLQSMATKAVFNRYTAERPKDEDDKQRLAQSEAHSQAMRDFSSVMGAAHDKFTKGMAAVQAAQERGEISMDEMQAQLRPLTEQMQAEIAPAQAEMMKTAPADLAAGFAKNVNGFKEAMKTMTGGDGFVPFGDEAATAAEQKLQEAGFTAFVYGDALKTVAKSVDIPGIGRAAGAPPLESELKAKVQAGQMTAEQADQQAGPTAKASASASSGAATVLSQAVEAHEEKNKKKTGQAEDAGFAAIDPAVAGLDKSQAALSVLKAAMEAKSNKTKGMTSGQTDANATIILDMLKAADGKKTQTVTPDSVFTTGTNQLV